ncbi:MAG: exodeoxyribonuclease VII large subunit, partial [Stackebrandtia sp.]
PCLAHPEQLIGSRQTEVDAARDRIRRQFTTFIESATRDVSHHRSQLRALSPQGTLDRGYAIVQRGGGDVVRDQIEVDNEEQLRVRLANGELTVTVKG